jgi:Amidohydrolase family
MLARGAWLVPTLVAPRGVLAAAEAGVPIPDAARRKAVEVSEAHAASFRRAVAAGVKVAMGTDSGVAPHGRNLADRVSGSACLLALAPPTVVPGPGDVVGHEFVRDALALSARAAGPAGGAAPGTARPG